MDYEKKYNEAINRAKAMVKVANSQEEIYNSVITIFPELRESEDERISKKIKKVLNWYRKSFSEKSLRNEEYDEMFAWLEKQEQEPIKVSIWKHWKNGSAGNRDDKLIYLVKNGNTYSLSSCLGFECDYIELSDLDNLMLEKQGGQKQKQYDIDILEKHITKDSISELAHTVIVRNGWEIVDGKEQKPVDNVRLKPAEWSEKDDYVYNEILKRVADKKLYEHDLEYIYILLKSLKERYTWKPSDEQIEALDFAADCIVPAEFCFKRKELKGLLEQLKKIREE